MAENGDGNQDRFKSPYTWAMVAGVVILVNGVIQVSGGNLGLGVASLVVGAGAIVFGYLKPGRKS